MSRKLAIQNTADLVVFFYTFLQHQSGESPVQNTVDFVAFSYKFLQHQSREPKIQNAVDPVAFYKFLQHQLGEPAIQNTLDVSNMDTTQASCECHTSGHCLLLYMATPS